MSEPKPFSENYYERLGIPKNADHNSLRKAYKKCVRKFHPDHNPDLKDDTAFKNISEAYEILNSDKRDIYDEYGKEGLEKGGGGFGSPFSFFDSFFTGRGGRGGGRGGRGRRRSGKPQKQKTRSIQKPLSVTLEDLYNGVVRKVGVKRLRICKDCKGTGSTKKGARKECEDCNGMGMVDSLQQIGPGFVTRVRRPCSACRGERFVVNKKYLCKKCGGNRVVEQKKVLEVYVDRGMIHGQKIHFEGEADETPDTRAGDIVFVLQEQPHQVFKREGINLEFKKSINLSEALTGVEFLITHLDGRNLLVRSKQGDVLKPEAVKQIENEGFPRYKQPYEKGNLYIKFHIDFPRHIPTNIQEKLSSMLPEKKKVEIKDKMEVEDVLLHDYRVGNGSDGSKRKEAYDSDDEDEKHGSNDGVHMSCSIQ